jgi:Zn-dependent membrane protease YugP
VCWGSQPRWAHRVLLPLTVNNSSAASQIHCHCSFWNLAFLSLVLYICFINHVGIFLMTFSVLFSLQVSLDRERSERASIENQLHNRSRELSDLQARYNMLSADMGCR